MNAISGRRGATGPTFLPPLFLLLSFAPRSFGAEEKPAAPKPEPPRIAVVLPAGVAVGETSRLTLRGTALTNATEVSIRWGTNRFAVGIQSRESAPAVEGYDAARVGNQRLGLEFALPADIPPGTNATMVVTSPDGDSVPFPLHLVPARNLVTEKEPNNAFREAPETTSGFVIRGAIEAAGDVDVFQLEAKTGETVHLEVFAERLGSTLDASLTLYDSTGNILATNDDAIGRDPRIEHRLTTLGRFFVVVSSVNEKAAPTHVYLLKASWGP